MISATKVYIHNTPEAANDVNQHTSVALITNRDHIARRYVYYFVGDRLLIVPAYADGGKWKELRKLELFLIRRGRISLIYPGSAIKLHTNKHRCWMTYIERVQSCILFYSDVSNNGFCVLNAICCDYVRMGLTL